jgi:hypothetical protein
MSGSDEVGVDPGRVSQAASALENLRDVLAANVPTIVNTMNEYWSGGEGSPISLGSLHQAQSRSVDDATDMRTRAQLAEAWLAQKVSLTGSGRVNIPWGSTPAEMAELDSLDAKAEAKALASAEALSRTDPKAARAEIEGIKLDIADHAQSAKSTAPGTSGKDDLAWLATFYTAAAPSVANLATTLEEQDGSGTTTLSAGDKQILATFAGALATVCDSGTLSAGQSQQLVDGFTSAAGEDPWSVAMLLKAGPSGSAYGSAANGTGANLLAGVTEKVLNAYQNGGLNIPINLRGLAGDPSNSQIKAAVAANDPLSAMLTLDAQNQTAAQEVMAGYNPVNGTIDQAAGKQWASLLMNQALGPNIYTPVFPMSAVSTAPGYFKIMSGYGPPTGLGEGNQSGPEWDSYSMDPNVIAGFLSAATAGPRGGGTLTTSQFSAYAAVNIITAAPAPAYAGGTNLPQPVIQALDDTFVRYMPDIAASSVDGPLKPDISTQGGGWNFTMSPSDLANFIGQLSSTPQNYGYIKGAVASAAGTAIAMQLQDVGQNGKDLYDNLVSLYGALVQENNDLGYEHGLMTDANDAQLNAEISFAEGFIKDIPVVGSVASTTLSWDQQMAIFGFPQIPQFSTDNAQIAAAEAKSQMTAARLAAVVPLMRGLAQAQVPIYLKPDGPHGPTISENVAQVGEQQGWFVNGTIVPNDAFWSWWGNNSGRWAIDQSAPTADSTQLDSLLDQWWDGMQNGAVNIGQNSGS